ncbi:sporulation lipoprotein, YhcN/YlaJ family [Caminicella sporogenes DSM 14501]|uniref:Sporulation lipoprotein, YhcN/YlaJ family n=1 Tax=Caminicella sporogenes DSM 14501 TaxID=1121266 RepID=A0A1M6SH53_9FIRM|nr:YhcN/YlaJ family sporulation lipoprotein [Caminicella sporogenes]RKD26656.1 hypothetical protein BET04_10245 [Caminicella sporogenes]WIF95963.1 YhcN/YlaJ family sporulation lipoprotein [Caminicella sporogenes]SHK44071.1 sporulation lipoprotein, YhcN/YlaJ family [Caminicella sporogenes DSM 14501]
MNNNKKFILTAISLVLILSIVFIGCAPQQRPTPERYGTRYYYGGNRYDTRYSDYFGRNRMYGYMDRNLNRRDLTYDNIPIGFGRANQKALEDKIEINVEKLPNVKNCTVIKTGDTCYVGIDSIDKAKITNMAAFRTEIANKCRAVDPNIKRVYITVDKDRVSKLRNYARDIDLGKPVRVLLNNIEDLFR